MRIVIVGPGALGSLLAARIASYIKKQDVSGAGNDVPELYLLDYKTERADHINRSGLLFEEKGQSSRCTIQVETNPEICAESDVLFLCVKSPSVSQTLEEISPFLAPESLLLAMENGIGHLEAIRSLSCPGGVGITSEGATLIAPGHVRHGGSGMTRIGVLGAEPQGLTSQLLAETAELLDASGISTVVTRNPLKYIWAKLFVNVAINALTAINRCLNGELLNSQGTIDTMEKAVKEAVAIARKLDVEVEGDPFALALKVCESTAKNISSMHQDVRNKRLTEIDAINGAIVVFGEQLGIPTPQNEELVRQVKDIESSYMQ